MQFEHSSHVDHGGLFQNNLLELLLIYEMGPWSPTRVGVKKYADTSSYLLLLFDFGAFFKLYPTYIVFLWRF